MGRSSRNPGEWQNSRDARRFARSVTSCIILADVVLGKSWYLAVTVDAKFVLLLRVRVLLSEFRGN